MNYGANDLILTNQFGEVSFNDCGGLLSTGSGAPVNGAMGTGVGVSPPGALYFDVVGGAAYQNVGTMASPVWTQVGTGVSTGNTETVAAAGAISTTKLESILSNGTSGTYAATLAAPSSQDGQIKILKMGTATHTVTVAMTNIGIGGGYTARGTTTLTFTAIGDSAVLMAVGAKWVYLGGTAVAS